MVNRTITIASDTVAVKDKKKNSKSVPLYFLNLYRGEAVCLTMYWHTQI